MKALFYPLLVLSLFLSGNSFAENTINADDKLYTDPQTKPEFKNPDNSSASFSTWISSNVDYPYEAIINKAQGSVTANFIVEKDGKVRDVKIASSPHETISKEVSEAILSSEWIPGMIDNSPVRTSMVIPVNFSLHVFDSLAKANGGAYTYAEVMPEFKKSSDFIKFRNWVSKNINLHRTMVRNKYQYGNVVVAFEIDTKGNLNEIEVIESNNEQLEEEVLRVLGISPKWKPGANNGRPVKVRYVLPVSFSSK